MRHIALALAVVLIVGSTARIGIAQDQSAAPSTQPLNTGTITYPTVDNIDFREGTIECWVKLTFDPKANLPPGEYRGLASVINVAGDSGGFGVHIFAQATDTRPHWWCSIGPKTILTPMPITAPIEAMNQDEWHHIAITWKDDKTWAFFDGKPAGDRNHEATIYKGFGPPVANKPILYGDRYNRNGKFVLDDVRVSRVARKPEELGFHGELKPDAHTAILDRFEQPFEPDEKTTTAADVILSGTGGTPSSQCQFVEGKFGKGLQLHK